EALEAWLRMGKPLSGTAFFKQAGLGAAPAKPAPSAHPSQHAPEGRPGERSRPSTTPATQSNAASVSSAIARPAPKPVTKPQSSGAAPDPSIPVGRRMTVGE